MKEVKFPSGFEVDREKIIKRLVNMKIDAIFDVLKWNENKKWW